MKLLKREAMEYKELATLIGVNPNTISMYVTGRAYPSIDRLIKVAEIFRISLEWLILGTDKNTPINKLLSDDELKLLYDYRAASKSNRKKIAQIIKIIAEENEQTKEESK